MTVIFMNRWLQRYLLLGIYIYMGRDTFNFQKESKIFFFQNSFLKNIFWENGKQFLFSSWETEIRKMLENT